MPENDGRRRGVGTGPGMRPLTADLARATAMLAAQRRRDSGRQDVRVAGFSGERFALRVAARMSALRVRRRAVSREIPREITPGDPAEGQLSSDIDRRSFEAPESRSHVALRTFSSAPRSGRILEAKRVESIRRFGSGFSAPLGAEIRGRKTRRNRTSKGTISDADFGCVSEGDPGAKKRDAEIRRPLGGFQQRFSRFKCGRRRSPERRRDRRAWRCRRGCRHRPRRSCEECAA